MENTRNGNENVISVVHGHHEESGFITGSAQSLISLQIPPDDEHPFTTLSSSHLLDTWDPLQFVD